MLEKFRIPFNTRTFDYTACILGIGRQVGGIQDEDEIVADICLFKWLPGWFAQWRSSFPCLGNAILDCWNNVTRSLSG